MQLIVISIFKMGPGFESNGYCKSYGTIGITTTAYFGF